MRAGSAAIRVMVVEDEALIAHDIAVRLRKAGFEVPAVVDTGERAVALAGELLPDLVLMDIRLKGRMDGIEAAERLRSLYDIPVVYLTAHADTDTLARANTAEPFGYLTKPLGGAALPGTIDVAIFKHRLEHRLREREAWLATTLRSVMEAVVITDGTGMVLFINPEAERLTGLGEAIAAGRPIADVVRLRHRDSNAESGSLVAEAIEHGRGVPIPSGTMLRGIDDTQTPVAGSLNVSRAGANLVGTVLVFRDLARKPVQRAEPRGGGSARRAQ